MQFAEGPQTCDDRDRADVAGVRPSVIIAGGGVAGLEAALVLLERLRETADLVLVASSDSFHFRPLAVGEPFGLGRPHRYALAPIAHDLGLELVAGTVAGVADSRRELVLADRRRMAYDRLLLAVGAVGRAPSPFGVLFDRAHDGPAFEEVVSDLQMGLVSDVAFVVPSCVTWPLPAYELALMTAAWGAAARQAPVRVRIVTHEDSPLGLFGGAASAAVAAVLERAGVDFDGGHEPVLDSHTIVRAGNRQIVAERVVVLPELIGPRLTGVPRDARGFVRVDSAGRVADSESIYAVGDAADHAIKHGGLAAQQAAAAANAIAFDLGANAAPVPYRPVLRGLLRTLHGPLYLRASLDDVEGTSVASGDPLWWPPSKLAAPRLTSYLARHERARLEGIVLPTGGVSRLPPGSTVLSA